MLFADHALARRLEGADALLLPMLFLFGVVALQGLATIPTTNTVLISTCKKVEQYRERV
jgi:hypothetical protein